MTHHELKCWPEYYVPLKNGFKSFEVRKNDRKFKVGDSLVLREWDPEISQYTGRQVFKSVTYILEGGQLGIEEGYCVMSLA